MALPRRPSDPAPLAFGYLVPARFTVAEDPPCIRWSLSHCSAVCQSAFRQAGLLNGFRGAYAAVNVHLMAASISKENENFLHCGLQGWIWELLEELRGASKAP